MKKTEWKNEKGEVVHFMKIIELLNKIANGEEVPEKIKYKDFEYTYAKEIGWYRRIDDIGSYKEWFISKNRLNDTVEIVEEQHDIDIQNIEDIKDVFIENASCGEDVKYLARKYNEILQWAKQLDKNIKDKE